MKDFVLDQQVRETVVEENYDRERLREGMEG